MAGEPKLKLNDGDNVFDFFLDLADRANVPLNTKKSYDWFIQRAKDFRRQLTSKRVMKNQRGKVVTRIGIGKMYFFAYLPKHRKTLPYYDEFPLVIPIEYYKDGFLGLNLHYLPPKLRAILLAKLVEVSGNRTFNERTKLKLSYGILKSISGNAYYKPCIKRYLKSQYSSKFLRLDGDEWQVAIALPVAQWKKRTASKVYSDSRKMIGK